MQIYVTGPKGRLGSELVRSGCVPVSADIRNLAELREAFSKASTNDVVIHSAAETDVDKAEQDLESAMRINTWGAVYVRDAFPGKMVHISSDYVFSGRHGPYAENSIPGKWKEHSGPVNNYGWTKFSAELMLECYREKPLCIVRTTGLYGSQSGQMDFARFVLKKLRAKEEIDATKTLLGNQTYIPHLVDGLMQLARMGKLPKVVHIASREVISRYEFAKLIADVFGLPQNLVVATNCPKNWIAKRPTRGGLDVRRAEKLRLPIYSIEEGLEDFRRAEK